MSASGKAIALRLTVEGAEQVRAALVRLGVDGEAALKKLKFDTSAGSGDKLFQNALEEMSGQAGQATGALGPLGAILGRTGGAYLAAGAAVGGFVALIRQSVEVADQEEQAQRRVQAVLLATGGASGQTAQSVEAMATRISRSTLQTKDDVENAAAVLATFRNVGPDAFERTIQAAADMAAVFGGDLVSNVQKLGLALDDPIKGMDRLRRSGLDLSPSQRELITNLQQTGDLAGAQAALLDDLASKMGGAAGAQHQGLAGATHDAAQAWHDFLVELNSTTHTTDLIADALEGLSVKLKNFQAHPLAEGLPLGIGFAIEAAQNSLNPQYPSNQAPEGHAHIMTPADAAAFTGPGNAARERQEAMAQALDQSVQDLLQEGSQVGERQRFINDKLQAIAKANETTVANLQKNFPQQYGQLVSAAGRDYDSAHHDQTFNKQMDQDTSFFDKQSKGAGDQVTLYATIAQAQDKSFSAMQSSQDALLVHQLAGQTGYFDAVKKQNDDWLADRLASIDAEQAKSQAELDAKAAQYQRDGVAFAQYEQLKTQIATTAANQRAQAEAESGSKNLDLQHAQQGPLQPIIAKSNEDINQSLKGVAADGLNSLENGLVSVIEGTKNVSQAFDQMAAKILEDLAKIVLEKQVIGPLGNWLNSSISSSGAGSAISSLFAASANGNVFSGGRMLAFADGGIVDGATVAPMALMGEAGPEAILPLARGSNGKLGLAGPSGPSALHQHFSPTIVLGGGGNTDEQINALKQELDTQKRNFFSNSVQAYGQMKSRRIAR